MVGMEGEVTAVEIGSLIRDRSLTKNDVNLQVETVQPNKQGRTLLMARTFSDIGLVREFIMIMGNRLLNLHKTAKALCLFLGLDLTSPCD